MDTDFDVGMDTEKKNTSKWPWLERTKTVVEILAIIVGGIWAMWHFNVQEAPAQKLRPYINGELKWVNKTPDACSAEYKVTFKNIGNTAIKLDRSLLKAWLSTQKPLASAVDYFNPHEVMDGPPLINVALTNQDFGTEYPAGVGDDVTNTFQVKRNPGQILFVSLQFSQRGEKEPVEWVDYRWGYVCEETPPIPKHNTSAAPLRRKQSSKASLSNLRRPRPLGKRVHNQELGLF